MERVPPKAPAWRWFDYLTLILSVAATVSAILASLAAAAYSRLGTDRYFQPLSIAYARGEHDGAWLGAFTREVYVDVVWMEWRTEMHVVGTARECQAGGVAPYRPRRNDPITGEIENLAVFDVDPRLVPCLEAEFPIDVTYEWTARGFGGWLPLRSVTRSVRLTGPGAATFEE